MDVGMLTTQQQLRWRRMQLWYQSCVCHYLCPVMTTISLVFAKFAQWIYNFKIFVFWVKCVDITKSQELPLIGALVQVVAAVNYSRREAAATNWQ